MNISCLLDFWEIHNSNLTYVDHGLLKNELKKEMQSFQLIQKEH